ncbi:hypothetical protein [Halopiger djelfimassiliensis]|uniref:hypothetical protein n=1 Tax=Halopiger djelfimassiliensis TaxID=1293047 RepID=UPI0012B525E4|nr:hypothetical protein [Halopiger djelfimassiliensis]
MSDLPFSKRLKLWISNFPLRANQAYFSRFGQRLFNTRGVDVFSEDWDNLLILDACRYDVFENLSDLPGDLEKRESRASTTDEFMQANVGTKDLTDTVYITASPSVHVTDGVDPKFHDIIDLWKKNWDDDLRTVHPEVVAEAAKEASKQYPNKRLLIHFLQPHYPFIGETGRKHFNYVGLDDPIESDEIDEKFWDTVGTRINDVSESVVREAYRENLEVTLPHVEELLRSIQGKTVVTADHGEMLNDWMKPIPWPIYGHPAGLYTQELVEVPWHEYTNGGRRTIKRAAPTKSKTVDADIVKDRLRDLGYA